MTQFQDELREILHRDAATLQVVEAGPEHAKARARQRNKHRRAVIAGLGVAGVVGGTVAALNARPASHAQVTVNVAPAPVAVKLSWRSATGTVEYSSEHVTDANGVMYALSTAPGQTPPGQPEEFSLYQTRDGEHFTNVKQTIGISHLVADDGVLYSLTSAPADGSATPYQLGASTNGGGSWDRVSIPLQFPANSSTQVRMAHRDRTTIVVASASEYEQSSEAASAFRAADRANLTDAEKKALAQQTPKLQSHEQKVLVRTDGGDWVTSDLNVGRNVVVGDLTATSNGYLLVASPIVDGNPNPGALLYESTDGQSWTQVGAPLAATTYEVKLAGDRVLAFDGSTVYTSADAGHTFTSTAVSSLVPDFDAKSNFPVMDVGPLGFAVLANSTDGQSPTSLSSTLLFSGDGTQWTTKTLSTPGVDKLWPWDVRVGTDHVDVSYNETGHPENEPAPSITFIGTPERS